MPECDTLWVDGATSLFARGWGRWLLCQFLGDERAELSVLFGGTKVFQRRRFGGQKESFDEFHDFGVVWDTTVKFDIDDVVSGLL